MGRAVGREMPDGLTVEDLIRELQQRHPGQRVLGEQVRYAITRSGVERGRRQVLIERPRVETVQAVAPDDVSAVCAEWEARYLDKGAPERLS